jgi:hypothetical protein
LAFTNNNTTVHRPGSVSCYPCAFAPLTANRCSFTVTLDSIPQNGNWLTFGISKKGMKSSYSDGFGRTVDSWGVAQDSSASLPVVVASAAKITSMARKLRERDVLSAQADVAEGWCEVRLNQTEFVHRFTIPTGTKDAYQFGVSLATDHKVSVLRSAASTGPARATSAPTTRTATGPAQFSTGKRLQSSMLLVLPFPRRTQRSFVLS